MIDFIPSLLGIALALVLLFKLEGRSKWWALLAAILIIVLQGAQYRENRRAWSQAEAQKTFGELESQTKVFDRASGGLLDLEAGCNGAIFRTLIPWDRQPYPVFDALPGLSASRLRIKTAEGGIRVSATIRTLDGSIAAELIDNEWKLNPGHYFQRNFDENALEILDNDGNVMLQLEMLTDRVRIQGIFVDQSGNGVALVGSPGGGSLLQKLSPPIDYEIQPIRRLFRYPAEAHHGKRDPEATCVEIGREGRLIYYIGEPAA